MKETTQNPAFIGGRMRVAREYLGLSQQGIAEKIGVSKRGIQDNETRNRVPGGEVINGFVGLGINANWLLTGKGSMLLGMPSEMAYNSPSAATELKVKEPEIPRYTAVPLYNDIHAAAGVGAVVEHEMADDALMFKTDWIRFELGTKPENLRLIRVSGDSMEPTLRAGDVILIDHSARRPDCEGIYILRMDNMLLVKRLQALPGGVVKVRSDNTTFEPWTFHLSELDEGNIAVIGRVVWAGRRF